MDQYSILSGGLLFLGGEDHFGDMRVGKSFFKRFRSRDNIRRRCISAGNTVYLVFCRNGFFIIRNSLQGTG